MSTTTCGPSWGSILLLRLLTTLLLFDSRLHAAPGPLPLRTSNIAQSRHASKTFNTAVADADDCDEAAPVTRTPPLFGPVCSTVPQDLLWQRLGSDNRYASEMPSRKRESKRRKNRRRGRRRKSRNRLPKKLRRMMPETEDIRTFIESTSSNSTDRRQDRRSRQNKKYRSRISEVRLKPSDLSRVSPDVPLHRGKRQTNLSTLMSSFVADPYNVQKPPWQCKYRPRWVHMREDIFPPYIQTGDCVQNECFFGMYQCKPKKYVLKVLRRSRNACNPVPTVGLSTGYEEAWTEASVKVTVACECSVRS